jgi:superfamily II DNA or RNA helicase
MQKVFQSFDTGFFDLIIADESHRSIYNVYGDIFRYFDCHQIGLTATPVDFVTKSTFKLFDCEGQIPTANYDLEQAVRDGYLTPFEVFEHTTRFFARWIPASAALQKNASPVSIFQVGCQRSRLGRWQFRRRPWPAPASTQAGSAWL